MVTTLSKLNNFKTFKRSLYGSFFVCKNRCTKFKVSGQITLQLDLNLNQYSTYKDQDVCYVFSVKYMSLDLIKACLSNKEYLGNSVKNPNENLFFVWSRDTPK